MAVDLSIFKNNASTIIGELQSAGAKIAKGGREINCPFCDDKTPSAGIFTADDGKAILYKCHKCGFCGDVFDVVAKRDNKPIEDVVREWTARERPQNRPTQQAAPKQLKVYPSIQKMREGIDYQQNKAGKVSDVYTYTNPDKNEPELVVFRIQMNDGKKSFRQAHKTSAGFVMAAPEGPLPIYNRIRIRANDCIVVVEGEKCVHALHSCGITGTTSAGGAGKAGMSDWTPLAGKRVYLWPDHDPIEKGVRKGHEHMKQVAGILEQLDPIPEMFWIDPHHAGMDDKEDAADYIERHENLEHAKISVEALMEFADPIGPSKNLDQEIEDAISGKRKAIEFTGWYYTGKLTKANKPGGVTILCGPAGTTKSFWLLEAMWRWHQQGIKVAVMELEEDQTYHLRRAVAQYFRIGKFTDDEWCAENPDSARNIKTTCRPFSDAFGRCIFSSDAEMVSADMLLQWLARQLERGCRILAIDPITAMDVGKMQWIEDMKFLIAAKRLVSRYGASLILVTHPKKGTPGGGLDDIAGGAAYVRFSRTVLWFDRLELSTDTFRYKGSEVQHPVNRELEIRKARDSYGAGHKIGFFFDSATFCSTECGLRQSDPEQEDSVSKSDGQPPFPVEELEPL